MARNDDDFEEEDRPRKPRRRDDDEPEDRPRKSRRRDDDDEPEDRPRKSRRRDDDDDLDRPDRAPKKGSKLPLILGILALVLILLCGGGGYGIYYVISKAKDKLGDAGERLTISNNLKQIGLGMHNYETVNSGFPTNSFDANGKPLLSWRVHILPYVEEQGLYQQFRLNEPWDSPNNKPLLSRMPKVYATWAERTGKVPMGSKTYYRGFSMSGAMMEPKMANQPQNGKLDFGNPFGAPKGPRMMNVSDGLSNTLLCVEAGESVDWTKPDDLSWAPGQPMPSFGGDRKNSDVFIALFGDGFVKPVKKTISSEQLKAAITYAGNEKVFLD
ncbi:DUF1559 family PulG-like putative transporter [Zavarzinella formosa]|uniref:DUF1559 family PulG-like putative transporter n=1 Tax=Zavarzinella formosa TaxID=360055 RepID=UPI0002E7FDB5|nr:DUF1559 domain-containing protein [Zavarzinella formosa]